MMGLKVIMNIDKSIQNRCGKLPKINGISQFRDNLFRFTISFVYVSLIQTIDELSSFYHLFKLKQLSINFVRHGKSLKQRSPPKRNIDHKVARILFHHHALQTTVFAFCHCCRNASNIKHDCQASISPKTATNRL